MYADKIEKSSRILAATSWSAIAAGVFVALAVQMLLLTLGIAFGLSVGDGRLEGGFAWWAFLVQIVSLAIGGAIAARLSRARTRLGGIIAGGMAWAVAIVIGTLFGGTLGETGIVRMGSAGAWSAFFGMLIGIGSAMFGGAIGATRGYPDHPEPAATDEPLPSVR